MTENDLNVWQSPQAARFAYVLSMLSDQPTMQKFLRDVMTEKEITEIAARLEAARLLNKGETYTNVTAATKLSSRTVARISEWLQQDNEGYQDALKVIEEHSSHTSPARA